MVGEGVYYLQSLSRNGGVMIFEIPLTIQTDMDNKEVLKLIIRNALKEKGLDISLGETENWKEC